MNFMRVKIKAFGLAEILIGLAITAGVLITITSIGLSAYRQVKDNELGDYANNVMLMGVEFFKTPLNDVTVRNSAASYLNSLAVGQSAVYKITSNVDGPPENFVMSLTTSRDYSELKDCSVGNEFQIDFEKVTNKFILCNKIVVRRNSNGYFISSYVVYKTGQGVLKTSQIIGYRQKI